ncbi:MAG: endonuclease III domain-containing protein [Thermoplasmatota archaeon]
MKDSGTDVNGSFERLSVYLELLEEHYGKPVTKDPLDPLDELILTILSQNTNDLNRDRAYSELRRRYPTNEELADADVSDIEDAIRVGGLARSKSANIHGILNDLRDNKGSISLDYIRDMDDDEVMRELTGMRGVGTKTAACVLIFSLHRPVFPVDTHIHRIAKRWDLVPWKTDRNTAQEILNVIFPDDWKYHGHLLIIEHGRRTCKARSPHCGICPLGSDCPRIGVQ